jgi:hypothetical protein
MVAFLYYKELPRLPELRTVLRCMIQLFPIGSTVLSQWVHFAVHNWQSLGQKAENYNGRPKESLNK